MAAVPSARLTWPPAELLIKILELLPVRETCTLRIVSSGIKAFINKNEEALSRITADSHRQRIYVRLKWLLSLKDIDRLDILHRYTSYYGNIGLQAPPGDGEGILPNIIGRTLAYKFPDLSDDDEMDIGEKILGFRHYFTDCHTRMHSHSDPRNQSEAYVEIQRTWQGVEVQAAQLGDSVKDVDYLRARVQDSNLLQGPHYTSKHRLPRYPIIARHGLKSFGSSMVARESGSLLRERFRLPFPLKRGFSYCVKTQRMQDMVYITCTSTEPWKTALLQSPFCQAALLEEIFLF
ncbi:hypothetical protein B0A48_04313 [Cryoendolithus antarcticus]|uniref:F-box domain-containing protein n=1 Tax=Cryoendolithus antarcticus TaxID=1507870 RepID=A0A1V8TFC3_9PEZI|nr:hypothetical protein B0A48_04313 [Cryoendolithus antarcticus]